MTSILDPFLIYCPNEEGMNSSENQSTALAAAEVNGAIHQLLNGEITEDDFCDRLRAIGVDPDEYLDNVEETVAWELDNGTVFEQVEVLPSGLVIVR